MESVFTPLHYGAHIVVKGRVPNNYGQWVNEVDLRLKAAAELRQWKEGSPEADSLRRGALLAMSNIMFGTTTPLGGGR